MNNIQQLFKEFNLAKPDEIPEQLIKNFYLSVNGHDYYFEELEIYYSYPEAYDSRVFYRDKSEGEIFFHRYGFDICFKTEKKDEKNVYNTYGGILIRSLSNIQNHAPICGPRNCLIEILNKINSDAVIKIEIKNLSDVRDIRIKPSLRKQGKNSNNTKLFRYINDDFNTNIKSTNKKYFDQISFLNKTT